MQRRFADTMKELKGLINDWSAPCRHSGEFDDVRILLAVSGGIDSMCMAELFASMEEQIPFAVAHCNFHLRGEESDGDEEFVCRWASDHGVRCHKISFDTSSVAQTKGISIEMAARELRYSWFADLCTAYGYNAVAVAHNANDNAETLILNLLRGSGVNGLCGMSRLSTIPGITSVPLIRPLLDSTRKQIEGYMLSGGHQYREDSTNALSDYKRNRVRNQIFPIFEKINPSFIRTLNREMGYFSEAGEIVDDWCRSAASSVFKDGRIDTKALLTHKHWRYLLYHILEPYAFNQATLASIENLLESTRTIPGKRFESDGYVLLAGRNELVIRSLDDDGVKCDDVIQVAGEGRYSYNGREFNVEVIPYDDNVGRRQPEGIIMMDAGRLHFPFALGRWHQGDWFVPLGMHGKKKVSDLFSDLKYDAMKKRSAVMVLDAMQADMPGGRRVSALACVRIDNRYRISESTESIIRISEIK